MTSKVRTIGDDIMPITYNGEVIGRVMVSNGYMWFSVDNYEDKFKNALDKPGLSGFTMEIKNEGGQ